MTAALLALLLATDGGSFDSPLYGTCPDGPPPVLVDYDGGLAVLLPPLRAQRDACLMATCETRRSELEAAPPVPLAATVIVAAAAFVAGGVVGAVLWARYGVR